MAKNYLSDSSSDLSYMNGRILAVWGAEDLNVNARADASRYLLENDWPVLRRWHFLYEGRNAYYPGALTLITGRIKDKKPDLTPYLPVCKA